MKKSLPAKLRAGMVTRHENRRPEDYLRLPYARILIPEENGEFSAEVLEFPGCYAQGTSPDEAFRNLESAAAAWIKTCLDLDQEIPPPSANQGYGGRVALRLPRSLHRLAAHKAERDGVSLNQCLVTAVAAWVGADNLFERISQKVEMNLYPANVYNSYSVSLAPIQSGYMSGWMLNVDTPQAQPVMYISAGLETEKQFDVRAIGHGPSADPEQRI